MEIEIYQGKGKRALNQLTETAIDEYIVVPNDGLYVVRSLKDAAYMTASVVEDSKETSEFYLNFDGGKDSIVRRVEAAAPNTLELITLRNLRMKERQKFRDKLLEALEKQKKRAM